MVEYLIGSLAKQEAKGEEESLKLPAEENKGGEASKGDEDGQQGEPSHDPAKAVSCFVPDVRQRDGHHSTRSAEQPLRDSKDACLVHGRCPTEQGQWRFQRRGTVCDALSTLLP